MIKVIQIEEGDIDAEERDAQLVALEEVYERITDVEFTQLTDAIIYKLFKIRSEINVQLTSFHPKSTKVIKDMSHNGLLLVSTMEDGLLFREMNSTNFKFIGVDDIMRTEV